MKDWQSISESPFYEKANAYVEEIHNNDCTLEAFIDGAESRQAEIEELEQQIEKMKCCYNCSKWNDGQCADIPNSSYYSADFVCEDWEMKENE